MVTFDLKKEARASRRPGGRGDAEGAKSLGEEQSTEGQNGEGRGPGDDLRSWA